jgi:Arc/MetJ-type ribon-helix-helix transcriptional regulator
MTIHLSKDLEKFVQHAMRAGLYGREDDMVRDALLRLKQTMPKAPKRSSKGAKRTKAAPQKRKKPLTRAEFDQHLLELGLMSHIPDADAYFDVI